MARELDDIDRALLAQLENVWEAQAWADHYASADLIGRMTRSDGVDVTATLVGRRLSRLAEEGECEKSHEAGGGLYRRRPQTGGADGD